jgi:hypothetical protein
MGANEKNNTSPKYLFHRILLFEKSALVRIDGLVRDVQIKFDRVQKLDLNQVHFSKRNTSNLRKVGVAIENVVEEL